MRSTLLLLAAAAGATTVEVRFTADFDQPVTSTSSTSCRGGAYRAHALNVASSADALLRIEGGGVAKACGTDERCAQVFAAMGYDGWALNADDIASSSLNTFITNVGSKPVASNYASSYTTTFADLGGAVLLALVDGGLPYHQGLEVGWADALAAGASLDDIVVLCVSGISNDYDHFASNAVDAVRKIAEYNTEVDIVIATGISGLSSTEWLNNHLGQKVLIVNADADASVARFTFDMDAGSPSSSATSSAISCTSSYDTFVKGIIDGDVDTVQVAMLCEDSVAGREECDAGRAAIDAINDKNDGYFDDLLPLTKLQPSIVEFQSCGDNGARTAWQSLPVTPVASIGPGATSCVKSVTSTTNRDFLGQPDDHQPVVLSESSTATPVSDRSQYPNLVRLSSSERIVNVALSAVMEYYGWGRIAVVYEVSDSWARDAAKIFSENVKAVVGDRCTSTYCPTEDEAGHDGPKTGIRFDKTTHWSGWHKYCAGESSRTCSSDADCVGADTCDDTLRPEAADEILRELEANDAKIIYVAMHPRDQKVLFECIKETGMMHGAGHAILSGWLSEGIFLNDDGTTNAAAVEGARGVIIAMEKAVTTGSVAQDFIAHRTPRLDESVCTGDQIAGMYCDVDGDGRTIGGYGPFVVDTVYTLAKGLDSLTSITRQDPDSVYAAIAGLGSFESFSGDVTLDGNNERLGSMTIVNLQLVTTNQTSRRLGVPLSATSADFVPVGTIVDGEFSPIAGVDVIFPGGTTDVPCDPCPEDKHKSKVDTGLAVGLGCGFGALILLMAGVWYHHSKKLNKDLAKVRADLQDFKDSVVGVKVAVRDYVPKAVSTGDAGTAAANAVQGATWYWKETEANITRHDVALVKPPCWVAYPPDVQRQLEQAFESNLPRVQTGPNYSVELGTMQQVNARSGFKRDVLRDVSSASQKSTRPSEKANTEVRPDELLGEDALLLRKGSMIQIKDQRKDGWAYGTVVLNKGDESKDRRFLEDGISLSAGWFPLACTDVPSVDQLGELQKLLGGAGDSALDPPKYWGQVKDPLMAEYFPLQQGSEEYQRVYNAINLTTGPQQLRIHSIERVQNISLWQSYCVKKSATVAREKDPVAAERKYVRNWLFHGCGPDVVDKILQQGFNRSFCGKNATFYGKGVYFARDASYSTYPLYSPADGRGLQTIFAVRVVVGAWSKGVKDALTPDVRDARRNLLYDTTVDNMADPSIFVTYHDAQAYPEYRIRFTQSNPAQGHPQAGQKRPAGYKPNLLEGVEDVKPRASSIDAPQQQQQQQPQRVAPAPVPQPVAQPVAQRQQFMVQIPAGVAPGAVMTVRAPDGRLLQVQVPTGAVPGSTIQVAA